MFCRDRIRDVEEAQKNLDLEFREAIRSYEEKLKEKDEEILKVRVVRFIPGTIVVVARLTISFVFSQKIN